MGLVGPAYTRHTCICPKQPANAALGVAHGMYYVGLCKSDNIEKKGPLPCSLWSSIGMLCCLRWFASACGRFRVMGALAVHGCESNSNSWSIKLPGSLSAQTNIQ